MIPGDLYPDPLDLVETDVVTPPIIELCGERADMIGHGGRILERATVLQINQDSCCPKAVVADLGVSAGCRGASLNHGIGIGLRQRRPGEPAGAAADGAEQRPLLVVGDPDQENEGDPVLPRLGLHQPQPGRAPLVQAERMACHRHAIREDRHLVHGRALPRRRV